MDMSTRPDNLPDKRPAGKLLFPVAAAIALLSAAPLWNEAVASARRASAAPAVTVAQTVLAQSNKREQLAKGMFLIAGRGLRDPNFEETVVLLLDYSREGAVGLVLNRETDIKLSALLPDKKALERRQDTLFIGGPVASTQMFMLFRSQEETEGAKHVFDDVHVSSRQDVLDNMFDASEEERLRVYAGYAGWSPRQLDAEVASGSWHIIRAEADKVFDPDPSQVWRKLIDSTETRWADADRFHRPLAWINRPALAGSTHSLAWLSARVHLGL